MDDLIAIFRLETPVWEILVRGSAIYWLLFLLFRFVVRRDMGAVGIADLLVLVLVADAAQNAMAGEYRTVGDGAILILTLIGWNVALDWLSYRVPVVHRLVAPRPLALVKNGRLVKQNLDREFISESELLSKIRQHGCDDIRKVKSVTLEPDGDVSVILRKEETEPASPKRRAVR